MGSLKITTWISLIFPFISPICTFIVAYLALYWHLHSHVLSYHFWPLVHHFCLFFFMIPTWILLIFPFISHMPICVFIVAYLSLYLRLFGLTFPPLWHLSFAYFDFIISLFWLSISFADFWLRTVNISVGRRWWDPISLIFITNHVWHLCDTFAMIWDNSHSRMTKVIWDNSHSRMTKGDTLRPFVMSYTILQYSTVLPFTSATFSNLFWCF